MINKVKKLINEAIEKQTLKAGNGRHQEESKEHARNLKHHWNVQKQVLRFSQLQR
jgi:hypothetical protein